MLRRATHDDVSQLAQMNWQLIRDEGSDNPMTIEQLAERMTGLLATTYHAWIIQPEQQAIGYILVDIGRMALCDEITYVPLEVESFAGNSPAVAFWQSVGFTPCVIQMRRP